MRNSPHPKKVADNSRNRGMWARYGQTATEYAMILAAITLGASCAFKQFGQTERNSVTSAATEIRGSATP